MLAVAVHHVIIVPAVSLMEVGVVRLGTFSGLVTVTVIVKLMATVIMVLVAVHGGHRSSGGR